MASSAERLHFIRPLEIRGSATRYPRTELLRLLAIPLIRTEKTWKLEALKRELDQRSEAELEKLITSNPVSSAAIAALGINPTSLTPLSEGSKLWPLSQSTPNAIDILPSTNAAIETWHHVELLPGLKLLMSSKASAAVRGAAKRICNEFLAGAG